MSDEQKPEGRNVGLSAGFGGWSPIETAPMDGTEVALLFAREDEVFGRHVSRVRAAAWIGDWSLPYYRTNPPIAWHPMPAAPNAALSRDSAEGDGVGLKS